MSELSLTRIVIVTIDGKNHYTHSRVSLLTYPTSTYAYKMCTCNAFTYRSCKWEHSTFVPVSVCLAARLGLREKCQERIVNGKPDRMRAWPSIDGICHVCHPEEAVAEQEAKKIAEAEKKEKEDVMIEKIYSAVVSPPLESFCSVSDFEAPENHR
ncbi:hypothetical protein GGS21DRAFT_487003 [Xylaria nigripes]|nr:hypothetical protein GGS21DRAFT_487003 [Xylaria nigripes]